MFARKIEQRKSKVIKYDGTNLDAVKQFIEKDCDTRIHYEGEYNGNPYLDVSGGYTLFLNKGTYIVQAFDYCENLYGFYEYHSLEELKNNFVIVEEDKNEEKMRYIRTKDGRIIDTTKIVTGSKYMDFATNDESFKEIFKTEPLAKADIIEELCDEFVVFFNNNNYFMGRNFEMALAYCDIQNIEKTQIKGAIWTDKGLIYVAKINDKGELELLSNNNANTRASCLYS